MADQTPLHGVTGGCRARRSCLARGTEDLRSRLAEYLLEDVGKPSRWNTLRALRVLDRYEWAIGATHGLLQAPQAAQI